MTPDTVQERATRFIHDLTHVDNDWKCCLEHPQSVDKVMAFEDAAYQRGRLEGLSDAMKVLATRTGCQGIIAELTRLAEGK